MTNETDNLIAARRARVELAKQAVALSSRVKATLIVSTPFSRRSLA
jgi:hypothetical protein